MEPLTSPLFVCVSQGGRFHEARKTKMETAAGTIIWYH